jgi:hypothetical protein
MWSRFLRLLSLRSQVSATFGLKPDVRIVLKHLPGYNVRGSTKHLPSRVTS